jgi:hypothetical protein
MESLIGEEEVWSRQVRVTTQKDHNFWSDRWIVLKYLQEFRESDFLEEAIESLISEEEVWLCQTGITAQKSHKFWFDRLIALKFL